jgi:hypothetical protein
MGILAMQLEIAGSHQKTLQINFYELGTDRTFSATVKNGAQAVQDARLWTSTGYEGKLGVRFQGEGDWIYPGAKSTAGFELGDFNASQEKQIELKINVASPTGEHLLPVFLGHGGQP